MYKSLKTNLPKEVISLISKVCSLSSKIIIYSYAEVKVYLEENADAWQIYKHLQLNSEVTALKPLNIVLKNLCGKLHI
ncbi:hypothetical protein A2G94_04610 [Francisella endosymbiont of Ornithodoros moubata]|nr:hypothetical protein A2G94_04610 [Francisella endosymbiont of Ornithodoros moubata]